MAETPRYLVRLAAGLTATTGVLLVFGSAVRAHGAGLACPDWPLCFGNVVPQLNFQVGLEFGHRVLAGGVGLVFLGLAAGVLRYRRELWPLTALAAVTLAAQVVLGGLTVLELVAEWTVTSHLLVGNAFCALLLLHALALAWPRTAGARAPLASLPRVAIGLLFLLVPVQLALGGLVSSSGAGLACPSWPDCAAGVWFPTWSGLIGVQLLHRIVAYTLFATALLAALATRGHPTATPARWLAAVVLVQAVLGVTNVLTHMPVEVTLLHSAGAATLVLLTTWLGFEAWRAAPQTATSGHPAPVGFP